jgi:predicted ATPase/class 3 adenylate cyclase
MDEKGVVTKQQAHMPQIYVEKMRAARRTHSMQGERRVVTILFCDVAGSTEMAGKLDPEVWAEIMHEAFDYLVAPIYRYEGTVSRLMGDAILAFFGAPIAHEDDAERAVLAGLDILSTIQPFAEEIEEEFGASFDVRVGINTGTVVVGEIGTDLAMEYTAMGDAANLAARMEQTAAPGTVQIAADTYRRVAPLFEFEELGPITVKGREAPVNAYRVRGPKDMPGSLRGVEGLASPLIGRERELDRMRRAVLELNAGRGGILTLIGEAGLGKSRLIDELHAHTRVAQEEDLGWHFAAGVSYNMTLPFGVFRRMLRELIGAEESSQPSDRQDLIDSFAPSLPQAERASTRMALQLMLGLQTDAEVADMDAEARRREVFRAMEGLLRWLGERQPRVLVLDDLHWADPVSVDLIAHLFGLADELPLLFLCSLRPHRSAPGWQVKLHGETAFPHRYTEIALKPLSEEDSQTLIDELLTISQLPEYLRDLIRSKAEGNPFFVEEIIRMLIEQEIVARDKDNGHWVARKELDEVIIPDNLNALLTARIDRLPAEVRSTLGYAAVIGRSFHEQVLAAVRGLNGQLQDHLSTLQRYELIRETARIPEVKYSFHHELTRDAAYRTLLRRQRRRYHRQVGETLESLYGDRVEEFAGRLGHHFERAGKEEKALHYYTLAGDQAARLYANEEAIEYYRSALDLARRTPRESEEQTHLVTKLGRVYEVSGKYEQALELYRELVELGSERGDREMELEGLLNQVTILSVPTGVRDERGRELAERALAIAEELGDPHAKAKTLWNSLLQAFYFGWNYEAGVAYGERALALAREHSFEDLLPFILNDLARAYSSIHRIEKARQAQREAQAIFQDQGNLPMLADTLTTAANLCFRQGRFEQGVELAEEALAIGERIDSRWGQAYSMMVLGTLFAEQGRISRAIEIVKGAQRIGREGNFLAASMLAPVILAWIYASIGATEIGLACAREASQALDELPVFSARANVIRAGLEAQHGNLALATRLVEESHPHLDTTVPDLFATLISWCIAGEIALLNGEIQEAQAIVQRVKALPEVSTGLWCLPDVLLLEARSLLASGREQEGRAALLEAKAACDRLGSRRSKLWVLAAMGEHLPPTWDGREAAAFQREAKELIDEIASQITDESLRGAFMDSAPVQRLQG